MALGLADSLVGISHECDYPSAVRRVPASDADRRRMVSTVRGAAFTLLASPALPHWRESARAWAKLVIFIFFSVRCVTLQPHHRAHAADDLSPTR